MTRGDSDPLSLPIRMPLFFATFAVLVAVGAAAILDSHRRRVQLSAFKNKICKAPLSSEVTEQLSGLEYCRFGRTCAAVQRLSAALPGGPRVEVMVKRNNQATTYSAYGYPVSGAHSLAEDAERWSDLSGPGSCTAFNEPDQFVVARVLELVDGSAVVLLAYEEKSK